MPDGRKRNFVDIVNTEEQARWLRMLKNAQDVIKHEADNDADVNSLTHFQRFVSESSISDPVSGLGGLRTQKTFRTEARPSLPPGWKYAFDMQKDASGADEKRIVKIVPDVAAEDAAGFETDRIAARVLDTIHVDTPAKKTRKTVRITPPFGADSSAPSKLRVAEFAEHLEAGTAAAAAGGPPKALGSLQTSEGAESTAPSGMVTFAEALQLPDAPLTTEQKRDKQPAETTGEVAPDAGDEDILGILRDTKFVYIKELNRFRLETDPTRVKFVALSPQLSYNLGYELGEKISHEELSRYAPDMRGGVNHICVYCSVAENVIVGDKMTSLLRVVAVNGKPGDVVEKAYDQPIFSRVSRKEVADIEIQLRSLSGRLIPFEFGNVVATLHFRKVLY